LHRLLKAALRGPIGEVNKLIIALKLRFLDQLEREERMLQVEMLAETFEQELARLQDLKSHLGPANGYLGDWLAHDLAQVGERIAWFRDLLERLDAAPALRTGAGRR